MFDPEMCELQVLQTPYTLDVTSSIVCHCMYCRKGCGFQS